MPEVKKICFDNGVTKPREEPSEQEQNKLELTRGDSSEVKESLRRSQRRSTSTKLIQDIKPVYEQTRLRNKNVPERISTRKKSHGKKIQRIIKCEQNNRK